MEVIERIESNVRSYVRAFPAVFAKAQGATMYDSSGRDYLDFFAGAGTLNYGHNHPVLQERLIEYIAGNGITHSLDMATEAKSKFLGAFERHILRPRDLRYKVNVPRTDRHQCGRSGTQAGSQGHRSPVRSYAFTNGFHGMTLGSLAATGNSSKRKGAGVPLTQRHTRSVRRLLRRGCRSLPAGNEGRPHGLDSSGVDAPAAFIVETVQGEGGVNTASLSVVAVACKPLRENVGALLIVDDIQAGCGRTGGIL